MMIAWKNGSVVMSVAVKVYKHKEKSTKGVLCVKMCYIDMLTHNTYNDS